MIAIMAVYLVLLFLLVRFGVVTFNLFWKSSRFIVLLLLNLLLFVPMGWGAPQGSALVVRNGLFVDMGSGADQLLMADALVDIRPAGAGRKLFSVDGRKPYQRLISWHFRAAEIMALLAQVFWSAGQNEGPGRSLRR